MRRIAGKAAEGSIKSFRRKDRKDGGDDDSEARLYKKGDGEPARLCDIGHTLMENSNGLAVDGGVTQAGGTAEREAALAMQDRRKRRGRITLGADKAYDVRQFVEDLRDRLVTPHIAIDGHLSKTGKPRATALDGRTRHPGYGDQPALSQARRGGVRMGQGLGRPRQGQAARAGQGRCGLHPHLAGQERLRF